MLAPMSVEYRFARISMPGGSQAMCLGSIYARVEKAGHHYGLGFHLSAYTKIMHLEKRKRHIVIVY